MKDALIVLSGGMDSTTMLHEYASRIALAVSFDYGSNHNARELRCAALHCRELGVEHLVIPLAFMGRHFRSALLQGASAVPLETYNEDSLRQTVVPFRNGIMLSVAAGLAESRGLAAVMIASHGGDHAVYPDCRPEFVAAMGEAVAAGTGGAVRLEAPYTIIDKSEIALRGLRLGIDYSTTYSCYCGGEEPCHRCATCRERDEALRLAGEALRRERGR